MTRAGQARSRSSASAAHASSRCSQLSSTTRARPAAMNPATVAVAARPSSSGRPMARATATGTTSASVSGAKSTSHPPAGNPVSIAAATCSASRVFPAPPAPVKVTSRLRASRRRTSFISASRPTKLVSCTGRLCGKASSDRGAGKSVPMRGWHSCHIRTAGARSDSRWLPRSASHAPSGSRPAARSAAVPDTSAWPS